MMSFFTPFIRYHRSLLCHSFGAHKSTPAFFPPFDPSPFAIPCRYGPLSPSSPLPPFLLILHRLLPSPSRFFLLFFENVFTFVLPPSRLPSSQSTRSVFVGLRQRQRVIVELYSVAEISLLQHHADLPGYELLVKVSACEARERHGGTPRRGRSSGTTYRRATFTRMEHPRSSNTGVNGSAGETGRALTYWKRKF